MNCGAESTKERIETYAKYVLNKKSDISGIDEVADSCVIVVEASEWLLVRKMLSLWKVLLGLLSVQMLLVQIMHIVL